MGQVSPGHSREQIACWMVNLGHAETVSPVRCGWLPLRVMYPFPVAAVANSYKLEAETDAGACIRALLVRNGKWVSPGAGKAKDNLPSWAR